ncbi:MAG: DUF512 domain-containing protein [Eubacteriaceae bacterium]|nr:DUF512 domain-containing protein [Eubacteriaceae bacterium]
MHKIHDVVKNSPAYKSGIKKGDFLISINNNKIQDILDYLYLTSDDKLLIRIMTSDGYEKEIKIKNNYNYPLGIEFENPTINEMRSCRNKCVFCFIDQLPPQMRSSLYFKDDDYRLCFLHGNYVTLTNADMKDLHRIAKLRLSPVNISVHTTNPALRAEMLNNKTAGDILDKIKYLYENEIGMHAQIVLCPGINDGEELKNTLKDLMQFYPFMQSVSIVDVGLTKYRDNLYPLKCVDFTQANDIINIASFFQDIMCKKYDTHWVYCSDEIYIKAKRNIPDYDFYEDFLQFQNGVGFIAAFEKEFTEELNNIKSSDIQNLHISIACGVSIAPYIKKLTVLAEKKYNIKIDVYEIKNKFFGESITASGLLTGTDIINALKNKALGQRLLLPITLLKSGTDLLLDDISLSDIEKALNVKIQAVPQDGAEFLKIILNLN